MCSRRKRLTPWSRGWARAAQKNWVLVDRSQNTEHKSMVCAYSERAKARPTVSTPITWDEVTEALDAGDPQCLVFEMQAVPERVSELGELFAPVLTQRQELDARRRTAPAATQKT